MATNIVQTFTRKQQKNYVIIGSEFDPEAKMRELALAAAAMLQWIDRAKATFSASTSARYLESLYWDPANPTSIVMGVLPDTLASVLEFGQDPRDLNSIFLRKKFKMGKKGKYRVIPIDDSSDKSQIRYMQYTISGIPLSLNEADILYYVNNIDNPDIAALAIKAKMSKFNKARAGAHSFRPAGKFISSKKSIKFRTITYSDSPNTNTRNTPSDIWKHPGIRAALIGQQVSSWMEQNRSRYIDPIFNREPGFDI